MQPSASPPPPDAGAIARVIKIVYFVLFATVGFYWGVLELLATNIEPRDPGTLKWALLAVSGASAVSVLYLRFSRIPTITDSPTTDPAQQLAQMRGLYLVSFALAESVALYGFLLRMLGASRADAVPFFVTAVVLFLLCYPRLPAEFSGPGH